MEDPGFLSILIPIVVALAIVAGFLAWNRKHRRREALARTAARLGLRFSPDRDRNIVHQYENLHGLNDGSNRYAFHILRGNHRGHPVTAFDFHYQTQSSDSRGHRQTHHHHRHIVLLHLERGFPKLRLGPEGVFSKIAQAIGYDDIDFESHEFSRRFCVRSSDRKFAYDFCNPSMIEFLLASPGLQLEVQERVIAYVREGRLPPDLFESELDLACAIRERMPNYLFSA